MPPWRANKEYRSFADERGLSEKEVALIAQWIAEGVKKGDPEKLPDVPHFPSGSQLLGQPDLTLKMREPFTVKGDNQQTYICYMIPFELPSDTFARAIEFIPGNRQLVHHASYQVLEVADDVDFGNAPDYFIFGEEDYIDDEHDYGFFNLYSKDGTPPKELFHNGWLPGVAPQVYPDGVGFRLPKKGVLLIRNLHYAPSPIPQSDQSTINIYFSEKPVNRTVLFKAFKPANPNPGEDWIIPADSVMDFYINVRIGADLSLLAVNPHMHRLGKYFKVFAVAPSGDTIPVVEIPEWDFDWQDFYRFRHIVRIPKGSFLHAVARFDNTADNPENPYDPPRPIYFERGMDEKDEMMRLSFLFLPYQEGDEGIVMDGMTVQ